MLEALEDQAQSLLRGAEMRLGPTAHPATGSVYLTDCVIVDEFAQRLRVLRDAVWPLHAHLEHGCAPERDRACHQLAALSTSRISAASICARA